MSSVLIVTVAFTTDEATFLASLLSRWSGAAPTDSAERFWLERLYNRVQQGLVDVVAGDSAARLAASNAPSGIQPSPFSFAAPSGGGLPPPPPPTAPATTTCTCGHHPGSVACNIRRKNGTHP